MSTDAPCIFCEILAGRAEATFLHCDEVCAAFMDIQPVNPGHLLVVPVAHVASFCDLDPDTAAHLMRVGHRMARALRASGLRCEGLDLFLADGAAAMQEVMHAHLHVFPRWRGDGFGLRFGPDYVRRARADLEAAATPIRGALGELRGERSEVWNDEV